MGRIPRRDVAPATAARGRLAQWSALAWFGGICASLAAGYHWAAVPVTLTIDGGRRAFRTHAATVADLLVERSVAVAPGDLVVPPPDARLRAGDAVAVRRARAVRVRADGRVVALRTHARSPLAVLHEAGVTLAPGDAVKVNGAPSPVDRPLTLAVQSSPDADDALAPIHDPRDPAARGAGLARWLDGLGALPPVVAVASAAGLGQPGGEVAPAGPDGGMGDGPGGAAGSAPAVDSVDRDDPAAAGHAGLPRPGGSDGAAGSGPDVVVDVLRAVPVSIVEDGVAFGATVAGATVAEALASAGIAVLEGDEVDPPLTASLEGSMRIAIWRAAPFVVVTDGETREVRAKADTIAEALTDAGLALEGRDYSIPPADAPLVAGMTVEVVRVHQDIQVLEVEIPFASITEADPSLPLDEQRVLQAGQSGLKSQRVRITYENGAVADREILDETVLRPAVDARVAYGTQVVWRTIDTPEGPKQYWRKLRMYATSYSPARAGTPITAPWYGRARNGMVMRKGIVATDRSIIPMGMWVYVPGYGVAIAGDTGGGVRKYMIDLGYADDDYVSWHQYVDVYILDRLPPEHQMRWILP